MNWNVITLRTAATLLVALSVSTLGCATFFPDEAPARPAIQDTNLISANHGAADALLTRAPWLKDRKDPLLAATFVDINNLDTSSGLGRVIGEQLGSRFAQQGFTVVEIKMRNNIFIKEGSGEFALSRSIREISQSHNAAAVIAGTYAAVSYTHLDVYTRQIFYLMIPRRKKAMFMVMAMVKAMVTVVE